MAVLGDDEAKENQTEGVSVIIHHFIKTTEVTRLAHFMAHRLTVFSSVLIAIIKRV